MPRTCLSPQWILCTSIYSCRKINDNKKGFRLKYLKPLNWIEFTRLTSITTNRSSRNSNLNPRHYLERM